MNSVHDVDLDEIAEVSEPTSVTNDEEDEEQEEDAEMNSSHDQKEQHAQQLQEWPLPLNEPRSDTPLAQIFKPTIFFNKKIKLIDKSSIKSIKKDEYLTDAASTPFDRYQLSNEIIQLLSDPIKKEALDMENPVVKAIYETVFCDPSELDQRTYEDEKPHVLEKVFTEGEFIPFNPLVRLYNLNYISICFILYFLESSRPVAPKLKSEKGLRGMIIRMKILQRLQSQNQ
jgi:hypothetical protein